MKDSYISERMKPLCMPTIWQNVIQLVHEIKGINLSQGAPQFGPQYFFVKNLQKASLQICHDECHPKGILQLRQIIKIFHEKQYKQIDSEKNISVMAGASAALYFTFLCFLEPDDEVLLFQPAFDFYRHYANLCQVKTTDIKLYPKQLKTRKQIKQMITNSTLSESKNWQIDWKQLELKLTKKVKIIVLNNPHNPTGKIFTQDEIDWICQLALDLPDLIIVQDCVYQGFMFDEYKGKFLPKTIHSKYYKQLKNRIIHIYSAGKLLQATGIRVGWIISDQQTIKNISKLHETALFNVPYLVQKTVYYCLNDIINEKFYYLDLEANRLQHHRQELLKVLSNSKYNFKISIPKSGYFILVDISDVSVKEKYYSQRLKQGQKRNKKDLAFCYQMAIQDQVIVVPCSTFFSQQNIQENFIRFALCKNIDMIKSAGQKLKDKNIAQKQTLQ